MPFELKEVLRARRGENFRLQAQYMNPQMGRVLKTIGFDHYYERGEGCYLYDAEGRRYLDFLSGFGVFALGRGHPAVTRAIHEALDADLPNLVQMDCALLPGLLAEALVTRSHPGIERAFFTNSGAEAIESAIKFARAATKRSRIVYCDHGFHGLTTGALSLNGGREFRDGFGPLLPTHVRSLRRHRRPGPGAAPRRRGRLRGRAHPGKGREPRLRGVLAARSRPCAGATRRSS